MFRDDNFVHFIEHVKCFQDLLSVIVTFAEQQIVNFCGGTVTADSVLLYAAVKFISDLRKLKAYIVAISIF